MYICVYAYGLGVPALGCDLAHPPMINNAPEQSLAVDTEKESSVSPREQEQERKQQQLAARENNAVKQSKRLVYLALSLAAVAVGAATFVLTSGSEEDDFESEVSVAGSISSYTKNEIPRLHAYLMLVLAATTIQTFRCRNHYKCGKECLELLRRRPWFEYSLHISCD